MYKIIVEVNDNLYECRINIKKWNNKDDNKFIIFLKSNIILFELTNDIELKIINQSYFSEVKNLKILNEKNNRFYDEYKYCPSRNNGSFTIYVY